MVQGCPNKSYPDSEFTNRPRKRFFSFPKDQARVKVWLAALRETDKVPSEEHRICEDHFLKDHITQHGISEDAIPIMPPYLDGTLALPAESEELADLSDVDDLQVTSTGSTLDEMRRHCSAHLIDYAWRTAVLGLYNDDGHYICF